MTTAPALPLAPLRTTPRPRRSLSPHVLLVANGNASGLARRPGLVSESARLLQSAGARVETHVTETVDELYDLLAAAERRVVLLGGDGSLHAAANAPVRPELAIIPGGSANNIAHSLGIPTELRAASRLAIEGRARPLDAIAVETATSRYLAVEGVSVGFHALARAQYTAKNSADVVAGIRAAARVVRDFRPLTIGLAVDGEPRLVRIAQLFAANMPWYGPRLRVAPADPADGLLDVVTIDGGRAALAALVPHLRRGTHIGRRGVEHVRARSLRIATRGQSPIIADTTNVGDSVQLTIEPHALAVVGAAA